MRAGAFVRRLHDAVPHHADGTISLHGDLAPWNVVVDGDRWFAIGLLLVDRRIARQRRHDG